MFPAQIYSAYSIMSLYPLLDQAFTTLSCQVTVKQRNLNAIDKYCKALITCSQCDEKP